MDELALAAAIASLQEADVFGEIALLALAHTRRAVRCLTDSVLLSLGRVEFEQLLLSCRSRATIEQTVEKMAFLQRIPLSRHWSPHAVAAFARRSIFQDFRPGEIVITEGREVQGTGLGLPLTKALVEANRARLSMSSEPRKGTLAEVIFPTTRVLAE